MNRKEINPVWVVILCATLGSALSLLAFMFGKGDLALKIIVATNLGNVSSSLVTLASTLVVGRSPNNHAPIPENTQIDTVTQQTLRTPVVDPPVAEETLSA